jgi:ribosomal protein L29
MHNGEVQNVRAAGVKKRELARVLTALSANSGEEKK